jgi:Cu-Zn family superoxide dismutase
MLLVGRTLYVVRNAAGLVVPVRLSRDLRSGRVGEGATSPALRFPTTIARDGRRLLVVNSQFDRRGGPLAPDLPFTVVAIDRPRP